MTVICEKHGPLLPCIEHVTQRGRKDPAKFPVPSFVQIKESNIPGAGQGVFATKFIEPGQIIGEYKGKMLTEKDYKKLESEDKESGYAFFNQKTQNSNYRFYTMKFKKYLGRKIKI